MTTLTEQLDHLASRGNRSLSNAEEINDTLGSLAEACNMLAERCADFDTEVDAYRENDPAEAVGTEDREQCRENRTIAWEAMQELAADLAADIAALTDLIQPDTGD